MKDQQHNNDHACLQICCLCATTLIALSAIVLLVFGDVTVLTAASLMRMGVPDELITFAGILATVVIVAVLLQPLAYVQLHDGGEQSGNFLVTVRRTVNRALGSGRFQSRSLNAEASTK